MNLITNNITPNKQKTDNLIYNNNSNRLYSEIVSNKDNKSPLLKIVGDTRHYPVANKEWINSIYAYNKNTVKSLPAKDDMANKIIKSYFLLKDNKSLLRNKRMRSAINKSTVKRLFVSKPEIKQTNDKVIITVYVFDRERQFLLRKIYFNIKKFEQKRKKQLNSNIKLYSSYENWRKKFSLNSKLKTMKKRYMSFKHKGNRWRWNFFTTSLNKNKVKLINRRYFLKNKSKLGLVKRKRINLFKDTKKKFYFKYVLPYKGIGYDNQTKFLQERAFTKKSINTRRRVLYTYLKHMLAIFKVKMLSFENIEIKRKKNKDSNLLLKFIYGLNKIRKNNKIILFAKGNLNPFIISLGKTSFGGSYLNKVNSILSVLLKNILSNHNISTQKFYSSLFNFSRVNFKNFLTNQYISDSSLKNSRWLDKFKLEIGLINNYINLRINYLKYGKYLTGLKVMLSKIYNKNAELNIVNLKYPHLNADILTKAISIKLRKRSGLLKVLNSSLALIKTPYSFNNRSSVQMVNNIQSLNTFSSLKLNKLEPNRQINNKDSLEIILKRLYPQSLINNFNNINNKKNSNEKTSKKIVSILNTIKYKWLTGVKLEGAGRLTRRNTASRSAYKYVSKGSLKDVNSSSKLGFIKKSVRVAMVRSNVKPHHQYSFIKSKRRIGAFGVKGWISSY